MVTLIPISLHIFSNSISAIVNAVAVAVGVAVGVAVVASCASDDVMVSSRRHFLPFPITPCVLSGGVVLRLVGAIELAVTVLDAVLFRIGQNLRLCPRSLQ